MSELEKQVNKMPQPKIIEVSSNSRLAFTFNENMPLAVTINWQWVLAKINEALFARSTQEVIKLLFLDLDLVQIHNNALLDIQNIVRQTVKEKDIIEIQAKLDSFKELMTEYIQHSLTNKHRLDYVINESSFVVQKLKDLDVIGLGAFMIVAGFRLALLQEKAQSDIAEWSNVKNRAIEYSDYAMRVSPKLIKFSVGKIDKECRCTTYKSAMQGEEITEYECRYFDGKDLHIFRDLSPNVVNECNKHRLQKFQNAVDSVNQIATQPVREASKKWQELAAGI